MKQPSLINSKQIGDYLRKLRLAQEITCPPGLAYNPDLDQCVSEESLGIRRLEPPINKKRSIYINLVGVGGASVTSTEYDLYLCTTTGNSDPCSTSAVGIFVGIFYIRYWVKPF